MEEQNPFQSPMGHEPSGIPGDHPPIPNTGMVQQVKVVGILQIVQGALELVMGGFLVVLTVMAQDIFAGGNMPGGPAGPDPEAMQWLTIGWGVTAGANILIGGMRIVAGIQNLRYRQRVLGIVVSILGLVTVMSCYCAPTSVALAVYALVVLLNEKVAFVFRVQASRR